MTKDRIIGVRDPHGFRPLALGRLGDAWVICSETCAMDLIGATYVRDVEPGEMVIASAAGLRSHQAVRAGEALAVHLRARLLRASRQLRVRRERQRGAHRVRAPAGARSRASPPTSWCRFPTRACARPSGYAAAVRHSDADGSHPQPLRGPHVHPAAAVDPPLRRAREAQSRQEHPRAASAWCWWTTRSCAARPAARSSGWCAAPARAKCTCASAARRRSRRASTAWTRRAARS